MGSCHEQVSAAPKASSFPFLRLPLEIQYQVCSLLCRHCRSPPSSPSATLFEAAGASFTTLKALAETCRALNAIAQPILYHHPDVKTYTPFFKTVTARPTLAASVKVLATIYESGWSPFRPGPERFAKEDFTYLIKLGQEYKLNEDVDDKNTDYWAWDDASFMRCFSCLTELPNGDQEGYTMDLAFQAYSSLLTALHFAILPKLEFAVIDLYDGKSSLRHSLPESGQLLLTYPYLPKVVIARPDHFSHLTTVVFRRSYHYRQDSLGLERIAFLLPALPNIRVVFFDRLLGEKDEHYQEPPSSVSSVELSWPALSRLEEVYFDPCARPRDPPPLVAISNMLQRCPLLTKLVYRHKHPDQYKPALFSPAALLDAILHTKDRLLRLELCCSNAKIPFFSKAALLNIHLKEFTVLTTLILDEQLFCQHWLSDSCQDSCLIDILPENISSLTIRLHDKFKAVPDVVRLGRAAASGHYSKLSSLQVHVIQDHREPEDLWNSNQDPDAFDDQYLLHGIPVDKWQEALQELAGSIRPAVVEAFQDTEVRINVQYVFEVNFSYARAPMDVEYLC